MTYEIPFETLATSENLTPEFEPEELDDIGRKVIEWYDLDKMTRSSWEKKYEEALKLALQVMEQKSFPWPNAANIKFPLLTIAALQFSARVYPNLIKPPDVVKVRKNGSDRDGRKSSRAHRVGKYMSYQLLEENEDWEEQQDRLFIILPILGCAFKKTYFDPVKDMVCSKLVLPDDLVVAYYTKQIDEAERKTERFKLFPRAIKERQNKGTYRDIALNAPSLVDQAVDTPSQKVADKRQGLDPGVAVESSDELPREILECHCFWDFDGDGYKEPYIITVDKDTSKVLRIVHRFGKVSSKQSEEVKTLKLKNLLLAQTLQSEMKPGMKPQEQAQMMDVARQVEQAVTQNQQKIESLMSEPPEIIAIEPLEYYTKYSFIPSPDGGFYDLGFGQLLAPLNESVNTIINQLVDSGTLQTSSSGFLGRGARLEGGALRFKPFEWKYVNVPGGDLKSSIVPLPINQPSDVLLKLLEFIVQYAERVSSVTEVMQGSDVGQNTPAFNMSAMLEQGLQVFNGVFKRVYRSFRAEIRKIYKLNSIHLDLVQYIETMDGPLEILQADFKQDDKDILPAADPNAFSDQENMMKAQFLAQRSAMVPGYNPIAVEKRLLEAVDVTDTDEIYPLDQKGQWVIPPPQNPEIELQKAELQLKAQEGKAKLMLQQAELSIKQAESQMKNLLAMSQAKALDDGQVIERAKILLEKQKIAHDAQTKAMQMILDAHEQQEEMAMRRKEMEHESVMMEHEKEKARIDVEKAKHQAAKAKEKPKATDGSTSK